MAATQDAPTRRSSSQTSDNSNKSQKTKPVRTKPRKSLSQSSTTPSFNLDPSLTSFPSLSTDNTPEAHRQVSQAIDASQPSRTVSQKVRDRKATLAGLTSASPSLQGQASLFDDSPRASIEIPGALHLASDDHIERLIARSGAVKLVRQYARDLAQRDAEISALRVRADDRERELKKMLREVEVSSLDIERRLHSLENTGAARQENKAEDAPPRPGATRRVTTTLDDMMQQAMHEDLGFADAEHPDSADGVDVEATIRPVKGDSDAKSGNSSLESGKKRSGSIRGWQEYIWGSAANSRKSSRSSSMISEEDESAVATARPRLPSSGNGRRKGLDTTLFQPPTQPAGSSYFIGGAQKTVKKPNTGDDASVTSRKSAKSVASWTLKLFAGNPQAGKEASDAVGNRGRASSMGQSKPGERDTSKASAKSGLAPLTTVSSHPGPSNAAKPRSTASSSSTVKPASQTVRRNLVSLSATNSSPETIRSDADSANLGPVEMETILPMESKPPTLTDTYNKYQATDLLTDRFGFIYDQRRKKRQREALAVSRHIKRPSNVESINSFRHDSDGGDEPESPSARKAGSATLSPDARPATPASIDESQETAPTKRWQDYLRVATRPTELLSHTPSAGAIVTLTTAVEPAVAIPTPTSTASRTRTSSVAVDAKGALPVPTVSSELVASPVTAEFAGSSEVPFLKFPPVEQEPVKLLLEQLTDLHDSLQREKTVKWNEFLRKVRAERQKEGDATIEGRSNNTKAPNMPEAKLADGEVIGVSNVGNKGKVGRAKWKEFKTLVLSGIPVTYRAKIWAECSGASALRVPGYYDDLVNDSDGDSVDQSIVTQIRADIHRTITDNVFFRNGPGAAKLYQVLLAYARRNPDVGYCQGMNLITASLLLIMPTAEDAFWILTSMIENILPAHYYDHGLVASRADQLVLRGYVTEVLPKLSAHLDDLGVELEALTFQWFLSVFTDCLSAEALYRVWDVVLCLNTTSTTSPVGEAPNGNTFEDDGSGSGSTFLFQLALALLKLNETQLLECEAPAEIYSYINHSMTNHAISIDGLINASEGLRKVVKREDVVGRRSRAIRDMEGGGRGEA